jgi:hypothetical protein
VVPSRRHTPPFSANIISWGYFTRCAQSLRQNQSAPLDTGGAPQLNGEKASAFSRSPIIFASRTQLIMSIRTKPHMTIKFNHRSSPNIGLFLPGIIYRRFHPRSHAKMPLAALANATQYQNKHAQIFDVPPRLKSIYMRRDFVGGYFTVPPPPNQRQPSGRLHLKLGAVCVPAIGCFGAKKSSCERREFYPARSAFVCNEFLFIPQGEVCCIGEWFPIDAHIQPLK